jgi:hypothetical protein
MQLGLLMGSDLGHAWRSNAEGLSHEPAAPSPRHVATPGEAVQMPLMNLKILIIEQLNNKQRLFTVNRSNG